MLKNRRVGTLTAGIILVIFGVLFLLRLIFPNVNYLIIISLWPLILIFLGIEIIAAYIINEEEKIKYDTGAIILTIILSLFAMGMAGVEFMMAHYSQFKI
ncbi:hypothetical protein AB8U03_00820 [Clostridium sp. Mt-5]|uniref:DUF5668 domain-containing protein n=1 Tax=Clostridium moutaii TaxID=3240932 RepID=A0ABV4BJP2_9CLOT